MYRQICTRVTALAMTMTLTMVACRDAAGPNGGGGPPLPEPDIAGFRAAFSPGVVSPAPRTFVSLLPGSYPGASRVVLTNVNRGTTVEIPMTNGGFDPVPVSIVPGEGMRVEVKSGNAVVVAAAKVPLPLPPVIVRTDPTTRRTSVPLNALMVVVFSEPIDPATINAQTVKVRAADGQVASVSYALRDEATVLEMRPMAPLRPGTDYILDISAGVHDLTGDPLAEPQAVPFQTALPVIGTEPFAVRILPDTIRLPIGTYSGAAVLVDSGATLINFFPDPSLTWGTTDPAIVSMDAVGSYGGVSIGSAWITVEYQGDTDSALVIVTTYPPPGPFQIFPGGATVPIGFDLQFDVSSPEGGQLPPLTWETRDPAIVTVDGTGLATMHAAGTAYVVVSGGGNVDSAEVEVYDPMPPMGDLYTVVPETLLLQVTDQRQLQAIGPEAPAPITGWSSANPSVATVNPSGILTAVGVGTTTVAATFTDGTSSTASVEVVADGTLGRITLSPNPATIAVGATVQFDVQYDATAQALWGSEQVAYGYTASAAILQAVGILRFQAVAAGTATVRAYVGPLIAEASLTVTP